MELETVWLFKFKNKTNKENVTLFCNYMKMIMISLKWIVRQTLPEN